MVLVFCSLSGSLGGEEVETVVEFIMETITLSHILCGGTLHPLSSIIKYNIKFLQPTTTTELVGKDPPSLLLSFTLGVNVIYHSMTAVVLCSRGSSRCKNGRHAIS